MRNIYHQEYYSILKYIIVSLAPFLFYIVISVKNQIGLTSGGALNVRIEGVYGHKFQHTGHQPGIMVTNPTRGQLKRENRPIFLALIRA